MTSLKNTTQANCSLVNGYMFRIVHSTSFNYMFRGVRWWSGFWLKHCCLARKWDPMKSQFSCNTDVSYIYIMGFTHVSSIPWVCWRWFPTNRPSPILDAGPPRLPPGSGLHRPCQQRQVLHDQCAPAVWIGHSWCLRKLFGKRVNLGLNTLLVLICGESWCCL